MTRAAALVFLCGCRGYLPASSTDTGTPTPPATDPSPSTGDPAAPDLGPPDDPGPPVPRGLLAPFDPDLALRLTDLLEDGIEAIGAPGGTLTVAIPGTEPWTGAAGLADVAEDTPMQASNLLRAGSITKTFTAAVVLQLAEEGVWTVDDPIGAHVDDLPDDVAAITLRQLLSHTSGIFDYSDDYSLGDDILAYRAPEDIVALALAHGLLFPPGAEYAYSNTNYILLGVAIGRASGVGWAEQVRTRLLDPLDLGDTYIEGEEPLGGDLSRGYIAGLDGTTFMDPSWSWAAGAIVADADDLARWNLSLLGGAVLGEESLAEMMTPTTLSDGTTVDYGLGLDLDTYAGATAYGHGGTSAGFQADMFARGRDGPCVALLVNEFMADAGELAALVWEELGAP